MKRFPRTFTAALAVAGLIASLAGAAPVLDFSTAQVDFAVTPGATATGEPVDLRLDLTPGTTWTETMRMNMSMNMSMPNIPNAPPMPPMQNTMDMTITTQNTAQAGPTEAQRVIETVISDATMQMTMNGQPMDPAMMGDPLASLRGQRSSMVVDERGMPENFEQTMQQMFSSMGQGGGSNNPAAMGQMNTCMLPDQPVRVGDSWTMTMTIPSAPDVRMVATSTLDRIEEAAGGRTAVISTNADFNVPSPVAMDLGAQAPGMSATINSMQVTMDGEGRHLIDAQRRGPSTGTMNMSMATGMQMPNPQGGAPMSMETQMQMSGTMESQVTYP